MPSLHGEAVLVVWSLPSAGQPLSARSTEKDRTGGVQVLKKVRLPCWLLCLSLSIAWLGSEHLPGVSETETSVSYFFFPASLQEKQFVSFFFCL